MHAKNNCLPIHRNIIKSQVKKQSIVQYLSSMLNLSSFTIPKFDCSVVLSMNSFNGVLFACISVHA